MAATNIAFKDVTRSSLTDIAANSQTILSGDLLTVASSGYPRKAGATGAIIGIANNSVTSASDNETVAKLKVEYTLKNGIQYFDFPISGGTITVADQGKFYNLLSNGTAVDGATESTVESYVNTSDAGAAIDPVIKYQVKLEVFKSATLCAFSIV